MLLICNLGILLLNHGSSAGGGSIPCSRPLAASLARTDHIIAIGGPLCVLLLACIILLHYLLLLAIDHLSELVSSSSICGMTVLIGHWGPESPTHHHDLGTLVALQSVR